MRDTHLLSQLWMAVVAFLRRCSMSFAALLHRRNSTGSTRTDRFERCTFQLPDTPSTYVGNLAYSWSVRYAEGTTGRWRRDAHPSLLWLFPLRRFALSCSKWFTPQIGVSLWQWRTRSPERKLVPITINVKANSGHIWKSHKSNRKSNLLFWGAPRTGHLIWWAAVK